MFWAWSTLAFCDARPCCRSGRSPFETLGVAGSRLRLRPPERRHTRSLLLLSFLTVGRRAAPLTIPKWPCPLGRRQRGTGNALRASYASMKLSKCNSCSFAPSW
jgi:hypothetical protein